MNSLTSRLCRKTFSPLIGSHRNLFARNFLSYDKRVAPNVIGHAGKQTTRLLSQVPDQKINSLQSDKDGVASFTSLQDAPGSQTDGDKYVIVYTCKVCDHRSAKKISKQGYHHGAVLVRCPSCSNLHLIADHLGIFEDKGWNIEDFMREKGENFNAITNEDILEFVKK